MIHRTPTAALVFLCAGFAPLAAQTHVYDPIGRLIWSTQPNGASTTYAYDDTGNLTAIGTVAAGADTDGDGLPDYYEIRYSGTLIELDATSPVPGQPLTVFQAFAFGRDPEARPGGPLTIARLIPAPPGDPGFSLEYHRPRGASLLIDYRPEVSLDLVTWSSAPADVQETKVSPAPDGLELVTVQAMSPLSTEARIFLRIRLIKL